MTTTRTLGLVSGILLTINVIVGSGIFVNMHPLIAALGPVSFIAYLAAAVLLLPVVLSLAFLARHEPQSGGLYVYAKKFIHPVAGFFAGWAYFVGKAISAGLMAHLLMNVAAQAVPALHSIPSLLGVAALLLSLMTAALAGAALRGRVQWFFTAAKLLPVLCVVGLLAWYKPLALEALPHGVLYVTHGLWAVVPLAVFAMVGFEVSCSVAHLFERPRQTIVPVFLLGFAAVAVILAGFQAAAAALASADVFTIDASPAAHLVAVVRGYCATPALLWLLSVCVYLSILGGTFGILTSNAWNMHRLALEGHIPGGHLLARLTASGVPWASMLFEIAICVIGVGIGQRQIPLQKMSVLSVVFSFLCAMVAALRARDAAGKRVVSFWLAGAGLVSTLFLVAVTFMQIIRYGVSVPYLWLFGSGIVGSIVVKCCRKA